MALQAPTPYQYDILIFTVLLGNTMLFFEGLFVDRLTSRPARAALIAL